MQRTLADGLVGLLAAGIGLSGVIVTWQTYQQRSVDSMGGHMGSTMAMHGTHPLWYLFGTLLTVSVVVVAYLLVRDRMTSSSDGSVEGTDETVPPERAHRGPEPTADDPAETDGTSPQRILELLPDDERRILGPVLESPGVTQIELRDRSEFSKSKVSQTVSDLEKRGLLYREPQGRTFRVYPTEELERGDRPANS